MTLHFLSDVVSDIESTHKSIFYVIIASLNSGSACKQINRITRFAYFDIKFTRQGFENVC